MGWSWFGVKGWWRAGEIRSQNLHGNRMTHLGTIQYEWTMDEHVRCTNLGQIVHPLAPNWLLFF